MKLISWNMNQRAGNWAVLSDWMREQDAAAAMVQEAVAIERVTNNLVGLLGVSLFVPGPR